MRNHYVKPGILEAYFGPMKCGKTKALIDRVEKIDYIDNHSYLFIKPKVDTRDEDVASRSNDGALSIPCQKVAKPEEILKLVNGHSVVAIDEAQFFDPSIVPVVEALLARGKNVLIAGLNLDYRGEPFGSMPTLMALADEFYALTAICEHPRCSRIASRTQRTINGKPSHYDDPLIIVEGSTDEEYGPRCLKHHEVPGRPTQLD